MSHTVPEHYCHRYDDDDDDDYDNDDGDGDDGDGNDGYGDDGNADDGDCDGEDVDKGAQNDYLGKLISLQRHCVGEE